MPNVQMLERLGQILNRPLPWFYTMDDELAALILAYHQANQSKRRRLAKAAAE